LRSHDGSLFDPPVRFDPIANAALALLTADCGLTLESTS